MAYDIFSQPTGPNISVSLFADAAKAGAAIGAATPSVTTSILKGAQEGIKTGLETLTSIEDLKAKRISNDQAPLREQALQAQIDSTTTNTELKKLDLENQTINQTLIRENQKIKLEEENQQLKREMQLRTNEANYLEAFKSATPEQQAQMVMSGQGSEVYGNNDKLFKQHLAQVEANTRDPNVRDAIRNYQNRSKIKDYAGEMAAKAKAVQPQIDQEVQADPLTGQLAGKLDGMPESWPSKVQFVEQGRFRKSIDGNTIIPGTRGGFEADPQYTPGLGTYTVVAPDGTILADNVSQKSFDIYKKSQVNNGYINGSYLKSELAKLDSQNKPTSAAPQPGAQLIDKLGAPASTPQAVQETAPSNSFVQSITADTNVAATPEQVDAITPNIVQLSKIVDTEVTNPTLRDSTRFQQSKNMAISNLARSVSDIDYEKSPGIQAKYNAKAVEAYNKSIETTFLQDFSSFSRRLLNIGSSEEFKKLAELSKVTDGKELYYRTEGKRYVESINASIANKELMANLRRNLPARRTIEQKNTNDILARMGSN